MNTNNIILSNDTFDPLAKNTASCDFKQDWQSIFIEDKILQLVEQGFVIIDNCFEASLLKALQQESGYIKYQAAHLTDGKRITDIRGDNIRWIDETCLAGMQYLQAIGELAHFFNQVFYIGIRHWEAHYACYPVGFGYQWHSDNPKGRDDRVISAVFYLNDNWGENDGGEILLIDKQNNEQKLQPKANRLVIFDSNLHHKVNVTHRQRYSIATWLRKDNHIL